MIRSGWEAGKGAVGLQEPQTTGHRNRSWKKRWCDSEGPQLSLRHPLLGQALLWGCVVRDAAFPDCSSEPPAPPRQGLGNIKAGPAGPSVLTSAHSRS